MIDRAAFIDMLAKEFPEALSNLDSYGQGLLHCEMAAFRRAAEKALDGGNLSQAERYFRFIERILVEASPEVENAIEVSFLEDLALGEHTSSRRQGIKERMPRTLQEKLVAHHDFWK